MQKSARILGQEYGMTAEEMNRALVKQGFLEGEPGDYRPTEKALKYVQEKDFHRGTGGYDHYNRYWTTRTFDESIMDELDITPEVKKEIREELSAVRQARRAARSLAEERAERDYLDSMAAKEAAEKAAQEADIRYEEILDRIKTATGVTVAILGLAALGYSAYRAYPHIKSWWHNRKFKGIEEHIDEPEEEVIDESEK